MRPFGWLRRRVTFVGIPPLALTLWFVASALLILVGPVRYVYGDPLLSLGSESQIQAWVWALAFVTFALSLRVAAADDSGFPLWAVPAHALVGFVGGFAALFLIGAPASQVVAGLSWLGGIASVGLSVVLGRWLLLASPTLSVIVVAVVIGGRRAEGPPPPMVTAVHALTVRTYDNLVDSVEHRGGALAVLGDDYVLVSGEGKFYRFSPEGPDGGLVSRRLPLRAPLNSEALDDDLPAIYAEFGGAFPLAANDIVLDESVDPVRVYLTHQYWNDDQGCLTIRVSTADLPVDASDASGEKEPDAWELLFETWPCVPPSFALRRGSVGSRLGWIGPSTLLLSIGDHGMIGSDGLAGAQNENNPYGKVLRLGTDGAFEHFTTGHRNPQGLSVGRDGSVWSTEHGPQGGDEVNALTAGGNYGWPLASYGVQYGQEVWPLAERRDHGRFVEPALALVPSIGVSNLIHLGEAEFPNWSGDLLASSMAGMTLLRLRVREDRVAYSERIPIGYRIRDLEQGRDGRIVLWTDYGTVLVLSNAGTPTEGQRVYAACSACHGQSLEGTPLGPPLRGVVGRRIAESPGFDYSPALGRVGGRWTPERLEQFLLNPEQFAPGTTMAFPGVRDIMEAFHLMEYLQNPGS